MKRLSMVLFLILGIAMFVVFVLEANRRTQRPKQEPLLINQLTNISESQRAFSVFPIEKNAIVASTKTGYELRMFRFDDDYRLNSSRELLKPAWPIDDIYFLNNRDGYAVGGYGSLFRTDDGGATWTESQRFSDSDFQKVVFFDQKIGYLVGRSGVRDQKTGNDRWSLQIFRTSDAGQSWVECLNREGWRSPFAVVPLSENSALVIIDARIAIRTDDSGITWNQINYGNYQILGAARSPNGDIWLVGPGVFLRSSNRGETWSEFELPEGLKALEWWSVAFDDHSNGIAVSEQGVVAYTTDLGQSWSRYSVRFDEHLRSVVIQNGIGVVLGETQVYLAEF